MQKECSLRDRRESMCESGLGECSRKVGVEVARCMNAEHVDVGPSCSELVVRGMVYRDVAHGGSVGLPN